MASRTRSEGGADTVSDPYRPGDHADSAPDDATIEQPQLGPLGYVRFFWRQLTSMRTAIVLLLLLALAAVPGSIWPQRSADPNGVVQYQAAHPQLFKALDSLQIFNTYTSIWFSSIYLLLFISLVGCIIPRTIHHAKALGAAPPATPVRLSRLVGHVTATTETDAEAAAADAAKLLRSMGYRVRRYDRGERRTVSAERGYLRESGNLVFHIGLVLILVTVAIGAAFTWTGDRVVVAGTSFSNLQSNYDTFSKGALFSDAQLAPYSIRLDQFSSKYAVDSTTGTPEPLDYTANVSTREPSGAWTKSTIKVNYPLSIDGTNVYLLGNGYAPEFTIRNAQGAIVQQSTVPFLPQDAVLTSLGVIKIPDGLKKQIGLEGFFYPTPVKVDGFYKSLYPEASSKSVITLNVYQGDLKLDNDQATNVYSLDTDGMTLLAGADQALTLTQGKVVQLPNGLGSIEYTGYKRFVSLEVHHDPSQTLMFILVPSTVTGLLISLFIPRRRLWVAATPAEVGATLEYAGLARGDDPRLEDAVVDVARRHAARLTDLG